jgi:valyl-tRNA synthetase
MDKAYDPESIETNWYSHWEKNNYFSPKNEGTPYCIMLPPPNVTGSLHMGHAFQQTLMDILIRYHRMNNSDALWQCGTDHAGIATQMIVERQLQQKNISRHALGREKFIEEIWKWKENSGNTISNQSRRLGTSMDWINERFTMDEDLSDTVREVFVKLYNQDLIYRGKRLVNWDPVLHTAISDLEVISEEENGHLWHMRYPLKESIDGFDHVVVVTTRPETMLGDAAVAVHPDDERYQNLIGKEILLPLTNRIIPIIADNYVNPEFGSGCVKITPAHDFNDYEVGERHNLEKINIFTIDAVINERAPEKYQGLDRFEARKQILTDLKEKDLLEKTEDHKLMIPRGDRSNAIVEPYLTDQWYVKVKPLAEPAIKAVENGSIKFVPKNWEKTYFEWMRNIEDWCISRQLWWGHRIPAWYDDKGNIFVGHSEKEVREKNKLGEINLKQDEDVLDTWFSSSLWPFSALGWPEKTKRLEKFYPTNVLVTGFDIIFFWVARMIMMGLHCTGEPPFKEVYIHGLVRDADGGKMSKSKGNVLDPLDLIDGIGLEDLVSKRTTALMQTHLTERIEKSTRKHFPKGIAPYGTDSLRFAFASLATQGRDIRFEIGRIEGYRNFCNKIWNATRFVMMNIESQNIDVNGNKKILGLTERWIISRLSNTLAATHEGIKTYRFDLASQALYEFVWNEYCDWYLEFSKTTLNDEIISEEENTRNVASWITPLHAFYYRRTVAAHFSHFK